ncbi:hypothetical protein QOZ80_5BG0413720 [Eleusine coracana subsp. coracana]|nr:hypothetical protein QOZ80_5BG0413720 [Eleusine coracana subsp. coracana]
MVIGSWWFLLVLGAAAGVRVVRGQGAPDSTGFISIDCGFPEKGSYVDGTTKLTYVSDDGFIDIGANHNISAEFINPGFTKRFLNVRSFPDAARSCYTLGSLAPGSKYLFRATFMYGNYDGLNSPPVFDLYLGVNFWQTMNLTGLGSVEVCLVNTGSGTPFVSGLELRPVKSTLYPQVNTTQGLVLHARRNFGPSEVAVIRYPDDPYDRVWLPWSDPAEWLEVSTAEVVNGVFGSNFEMPSVVMQTAVTARVSKSIEFSWDAEPSHVYPDPGYICMLHFAELQHLNSNASRQFSITINGHVWYSLYRPYSFTSDTVYSKLPQHGSTKYNISIKAAANSTLPPIINAGEVFSVISTANVRTDVQDAKRDVIVQLKNRRFTYTELKVITNNFRRVLGKGGFGNVYAGLLEDGTHVAVKLLSESSNQGAEEFLTEADTLTNIHHKNIVSLFGYCKDRGCMALVYERMSEGSLEDKLRGKGAGSLTWIQRLRIALESAQGLEYLHTACSPPLVHRDVKAANILLSANLEAKIADFGLLKAFKRDGDTHVSTARLVGTRGYLSPEYATTLRLTEKADVYSFGVVLLEVITGKHPIIQCPEPILISQWVRLQLQQGNIEDVVDARMQNNYDSNVVWKAADLALSCTKQVPEQRPSMTDVVAQLQECLKFEEGCGTM